MGRNSRALQRSAEFRSYYSETQQMSILLQQRHPQALIYSHTVRRSAADCPFRIVNSIFKSKQMRSFSALLQT